MLCFWIVLFFVFISFFRTTFSLFAICFRSFLLDTLCNLFQDAGHEKEDHYNIQLNLHRLHMLKLKKLLHADSKTFLPLSPVSG